MDLILGVKNIFELEGIVNTMILFSEVPKQVTPYIPYSSPQDQARKNGLCKGQSPIC